MGFPSGQDVKLGIQAGAIAKLEERGGSLWIAIIFWAWVGLNALLRQHVREERVTV